MITSYTKEEFVLLDFDTKCVIIEHLLTDDYFSGQMEIDFYFVEPENVNILPPKTAAMEEREDREFNALIERLSNKLFEDKSLITIDLENLFED
nr:hypothetical protein [uncultured Flavobacterium sp.]